MRFRRSRTSRARHLDDIFESKSRAITIKPHGSNPHHEPQCDVFTLRCPALIVAENFSFRLVRVGWSSLLNESSLMHLVGVEYMSHGRIRLSAELCVWGSLH